MDRLIYTALTGMNSAMARQRAVANNLANTGTPGFRGESFAVTPVTIKGSALEVRALSQGGVRGADMRGGRLSTTGQALDIAMKGNALMALQGADGAELYTRRGDLRLSASGILENGDGLPVLGENGPISVPPGAQLSIGKDGRIFASDPAAPDQPAQELGRIKLVSPAGSPLMKDVDGFLRVPGGGVLPSDLEAQVMTGTLEMSNVDASSTLIEMIDAQRAFEQRTRLIATAGEIDQAGARLMSLRA
ncbi:MAG: flagellar basal body rod protein FlgF [Novosphingobium sp.]